MNRLLRRALLLASLGAALSACGGDAAGPGPATPDVPSVDTAPPVDATTPKDVPDTSELPAPVDIGSDGSDGADGASEPDVFVPPDCTTKPMDPGCACSTPEDCASEFCLLTSEGKQCAKLCNDSCPDGYSCQPVGTAGAGADTSLVCVQRSVYLCMPCEKNSDCAATGFEGQDKCVSYGDAGSFCGIACGGPNSCPDGFDCKLGQCIATSGTCTCAPLHISLATPTACKVTNQFGTCEGSRHCAEEGLTTCDAAPATAEVCDGKDNNCNSIPDDLAPTPCDIQNDFGTCIGKLNCQAGAPVCQGDPATSETCNGKDDDCNGTTDDGYPNHDTDKLSDCVDPDDDDDGELDGDDNCPFNPNVDQLDTDGDKVGDACDNDDDGDSWVDAQDCAPLLKFVFPFAAEGCDGIDNDCDDVVDEASCDDANDCTDDVCNPVEGCKHPYNAAPCNDSNPCTQGDLCANGQCGGKFADCNDGNPCTDDSCQGALGCVNKPNTLTCTDGNICTDGDTCSGGSCVPGKSLKCEDGNPCTLDTCDVATGCKTSLTTDACDDNNPCTSGDKCAGGTCGGTLKPCDDGNPCTTDTCDAAAIGGCLFLAATGQKCDDGISCTINDACQKGVCTGTDVGCGCDTDADCLANEDGNACNGTLVCDKSGVPFKCKVDPKTVVTCTAPAGKDSECIAATCNPGTGACSVTPIAEGEGCDDSNACTDSDVCQTGACKGSSKICVDGNICTTDLCDKAKGCTFLVVDGFKACDDGNACTGQDACDSGFCVGKAAAACNDNNPCTDDTCDTVTGCKTTQNTKPCSDGDACTQSDICALGVCAGKLVSCDDGNACNGVETCDKATGCKNGTTLACDDGLSCTLDSCSPLSGCKHLADDTACNDGVLCNGAEKCDLVKGCSGTPLPNGTSCNDNDTCTTKDACLDGLCIGVNIGCDDNNPCTKETCDVLQGCKSEVIIGFKACDDKNACTTTDYCDNGFCLGKAPLDCNDNNPCTDDLCVAASGCQNTPNTAGCNDGNTCTLNDTCSQSKCVGSPLDCSGVGDGDPCTLNDTCQNGLCVGTPLDCSSLNTQCTKGVCSAGKCSTVAVGGNCNDGDVCTDNDVCTTGSCAGKAKDCTSLDTSCQKGICQSGQCVAKAIPCNITKARVTFASVKFKAKPSGVHGLHGSAGQRSPAGLMKNATGRRVRTGFHAGTNK